MCVVCVLVFGQHNFPFRILIGQWNIKHFYKFEKICTLLKTTKIGNLYSILIMISSRITIIISILCSYCFIFITISSGSSSSNSNSGDSSRIIFYYFNIFQFIYYCFYLFIIIIIILELLYCRCFIFQVLYITSSLVDYWYWCCFAVIFKC